MIFIPITSPDDPEFPYASRVEKMSLNDAAFQSRNGSISVSCDLDRL
jgi:hypothetical protein